MFLANPPCFVPSDVRSQKRNCLPPPGSHHRSRRYFAPGIVLIVQSDLFHQHILVEGAQHEFLANIVRPRRAKSRAIRHRDCIGARRTLRRVAGPADGVPRPVSQGLDSAPPRSGDPSNLKSEALTIVPSPNTNWKHSPLRSSVVSIQFVLDLGRAAIFHPPNASDQTMACFPTFPHFAGMAGEDSNDSNRLMMDFI